MERIAAKVQRKKQRRSQSVRREVEVTGAWSDPRQAYLAATTYPAALTASGVLALQRSAGNTAVSRLLAGARGGPVPVQRAGGGHPVRDALPAGAWNNLRQTLGDTFNAAIAFLGEHLSGGTGEITVAYAELQAEAYDVARARAVMAFLTPYFPSTTPRYTLAHTEMARARTAQGSVAGLATAQQTVPFLLNYLGMPAELQLAQAELAAAAYNVAEAATIMHYYAGYMPPGSPAFLLAQEQLTRTRLINHGQAAALARPATDFLIPFATLRPEVLQLAKQKLQGAAYDVTAATVEMDALRPYNYDPQLKQFAETRGQAIATDKEATDRAAATLTRDTAYAAAEAAYRADAFNKKGKQSGPTVVAKAKKAKAAAEKAADKDFDAVTGAGGTAEAAGAAAKADFLNRLTAFVGANAAAIGADDITWMLTHAKVNGSAAIAANITALFTQGHTRGHARVIADWALNISTGTPLAQLVEYVGYGLQQGTALPMAEDLAALLVSKGAAAQVARGLFDKLVSHGDRDAFAAFLHAHDNELGGVQAMLALGGLPVADLLALGTTYKVGDISWTLGQMAANNLAVRDDAEQILTLLGRGLARPQIAELLTLDPRPKKLHKDLDKRQKDPAKLKTLLGKVRHDIPKASGVGTDNVVDRVKLKELATKDPELHTQPLLEANVAPQVLIDKIDPATLPPKRIADITACEAAGVDKTALLNYAFPRRVEIDALLNKSAKDAKFVKRMKDEVITQAEAGIMARFEFDSVPAEAKISIQAPNFFVGTKKVNARFDHFAERHTYKYQPLSMDSTGTDATMWPQATNEANLKVLVVEGALNATTTQTPTGAYVTTAGGTAAAIRLENWSGVDDSVTQFYPAAGTSHTAATLQRFKRVFKP